jgi:cystathionine gamma-synthase
MKLETVAVHAGADPDPATGAIAPPIHLSTTFEHGPASEPSHGYIYVREANPTQERLEIALAAIHGAEASLAFASGMAAAAALLQSLPPGSHVLLPDDLYYHVRVVLRDLGPRWGLASTAVDMTDLDAVRRALRGDTRLVWIETPSNPLMKVIDVPAVVALARGAGAQAVVDNTFATPVIENPIEEGVDVVLHSTTKYFGGHSDAQGGALIFRSKHGLLGPARHLREVLGGVASPFNSWLVLRGIRSLSCRMERHSANGLAVASALSAHPEVEAVHYPGLPTHPGHELARRRMKGFGGMLSFQVKGGRDRALAVAGRVKVFINATSLGGSESLVEHRASMEGPGTPVPENLLRLSVGLEHPDDLIADLRQALTSS